MRATPLNTPKRNPKARSTLPAPVLLITDVSSGVKNEKITSAIAKTPAKEAIMDNSQLSEIIGPIMGISLTNGLT